MKRRISLRDHEIPQIEKENETNLKIASKLKIKLNFQLQTIDQSQMVMIESRNLASLSGT